MAQPERFSSRARRASLLCTASILLFATGACGKLIGIEDTTVTVDGTAGAAPLDRAGAPNAGATAQGGDGATIAGNGGSHNVAGSSSGGSTSGSGGSANGGSASGGSAGKAGGGASAGAGGAVSECPCTAPKPTCENGKCVVRGPTQVPASSMAAGAAFYIDATEISNAQYAVFLAAKGADTSGQRAECTWNKSYQPGAPIGDDKRPAVNVDFCDAAAYCAWADKRLCGSIAGGALASNSLDLNDATKSQWYRACGGADGERYPYGGFTYIKDNCNEYFSGTMADVGSFTKCNGYYAGAFDLVGNAAEWIDSCDQAGGADHTADNCQLMGGSFLMSDYTCQTHVDYPRKDFADLFGFRCCSK